MKRSFVINVLGGFVGFILALLLVNSTNSASALSLNRPAVVQAPASIVSAPSTTPISSTFTYQGQLKSSGTPVNGSCNMAFRLYDDPAAGSLIGNPITLTTVSIVNGYFTVGLNFGSNAFTGSARWLDIRVRCPAGSGSFTTLAPRQAVTAAPYALAPWVTSGSTLYYNSGNVGIGTNTPSAALSLVKSGATEPTAFGVPVGLKVGTPSGTIPFALRQNTAEISTPALALFETSDGNLGGFGANVDTFIVSAAASHGLGFNVDGSVRAMTVLTNGAIGIGTTPCNDAMLHVYTGDSGYPCSPAAVRGESTSGDGVYGASNSGEGVYGVSFDNTGVHGTSTNAMGVYGVSFDNAGVYGQSSNSTGVFGASTSGTFIFQGWDLAANDRRFVVERATGNVYADGSYNCGLGSGCFNTGIGADVAERINAADDLQPGDLVEIDPSQPDHFRLARTAYSVLVAGVVSTNPGVTMNNNDLADNDTGQRTDHRPLLALVGTTPMKVSAENGPIHIGDLLVASSTPGHAMRAGSNAPTGSIIGKALESWQQGTGVIKVLITLR